MKDANLDINIYPYKWKEWPRHERAAVFRLLGDPSRFPILIECRRGPIPVGEIAQSTGLSISSERPPAAAQRHACRAGRTTGSTGPVFAG